MRGERRVLQPSVQLPVQMQAGLLRRRRGPLRGCERVPDTWRVRRQYRVQQYPGQLHLRLSTWFYGRPVRICKRLNSIHVVRKIDL